MFLCVVAPSFFHVLRFLSVSFVCERKGAFRFGLSVAVSFIFQRFRFLKERLFAHVLRFRPVSSFRERMGVCSSVLWPPLSFTSCGKLTFVRMCAKSDIE